MTRLYCPNGHVRKTRGFRPEPDELSCPECGLRMGSFKPRTEPAERKARKRAPMKRSQPQRDWADARRKVEAEGVCRECGSPLDLEAAHIIGRERDGFTLAGEPRDESVWRVEPVRIAVLCKRCHMRYDGQAQPCLDVLPHLTLDEQVQAVRDAGGIVSALRRTTNDRAIKEAA